MFRALHLSSARSWSSSHPGTPAGSITLHTHPLARDSSYLQRLRTFSMSACAESSPSCNCAVPSSRRPPCTPKSQQPDPAQTSLWLWNCPASASRPSDTYSPSMLCILSSAASKDVFIKNCCLEQFPLLQLLFKGFC